MDNTLSCEIVGTDPRLVHSCFCATFSYANRFLYTASVHASMCSLMASLYAPFAFVNTMESGKEQYAFAPAESNWIHCTDVSLIIFKSGFPKTISMSLKSSFVTDFLSLKIQIIPVSKNCCFLFSSIGVKNKAFIFVTSNAL